MELHHYHGLDLPVFDSAERIYLYKWQFSQMQPDKDGFALRFAQSFGPDSMPLVERLAITEDDFARLEELTGVATIPHQYGLYPTQERAQHRVKEHKGIVPSGYLLAARVAVLREVKLLKHTPLKVRWGIFRYHNQRGRLCDIKNDQYVYGTLPWESSGDWSMVDIEPRVRWDDHPSSRSYTRI